MGTASEKKVCKTCGYAITSSNEVGTGYAINESGDMVCYSCCAKEEKRWMIENGKIDLYLIRRDNLESMYEVSNWPGTLRFPVRCVKTGKHNIAKVRKDVWFNFDGYVWHGVQYGNDSEICHCKKTKRAA